MTSGRGGPQALRCQLGLRTFRFAPFLLALLLEMAVDRTAGETIEDDTTKELRVRVLDLLGLKRDVARKSNSELHGTGFPHARFLARSHSAMSSL